MFFAIFSKHAVFFSLFCRDFLLSLAIVYDTDEDFGPLPVADTIQNAVCLNNPLPSAGVDPTKLSHVSPKEKQEFLTLLDEFADVFDEKPGLCSG